MIIIFAVWAVAGFMVAVLMEPQNPEGDPLWWAAVFICGPVVWAIVLVGAIRGRLAR